MYNSDNYFNNIIDGKIDYITNLNFIKLNPLNSFKLHFLPRWNGILIESNLRRFLRTVCRTKNHEKFLNLNRNGKYRRLNIDWKSTYKILNGEDKITKGTFESDFYQTKLKKNKIKLLIEEYPVIEQLKKHSMDIYDKWKCLICDEWDET